MRRYEAGMLAESRAGHDLNHLYVIIRVDEEYVYLVDGKLRTLSHPKKKKKKHVQVIRSIISGLADKLSRGAKIENEDIKLSLKLYRSEILRSKGNCQ